MWPQLACGKLSATWVMNPQAVAGLGLDMSHVAVVAVGGFPRAWRRQENWQGCVINVGKCTMRGRQVAPVRFAAMSGNDAAEMAQLRLTRNSDGVGCGPARVEEGLVSSVGTASPAPISFRDWHMADKQLLVISAAAFATTGFMAILLAAAIPSLLAIKKAAEALEKLADTAREELPGTMAAIRLSGMEISDLTMELNELGQEISKGVRSSARVLSSAESGMRQVGGVASNVWQEQAVIPAQSMQPILARTAKQVRESLVQTRTLIHNLQVLSRVSGWIGSLQGRTPILIVPTQKKDHKS
ncbi:uncharacterized protein [Physcomitrium patens]|uniref:Uncharacterized protein n=1 Tax=Physcomitrium patens TaxID=3218 RepID=A0A2K1IQA3_PHYPA|nr:uncharacterized protein LOC112274587 isoform X1 [Physcomitrium patens]PNR31461.1 hypothetical protein PHYPA_025582 [Physcomitrium patens]|eukprot:XP_024360025.1 uncharacterized protein LOC112274587 isoform X1 [Physcomitrella patens]